MTDKKDNQWQQVFIQEAKIKTLMAALISIRDECRLAAEDQQRQPRTIGYALGVCEGLIMEETTHGGE